MISWIENNLSYEVYYSLRESVGWSNFCKEQAMIALNNSRYSVVAYDTDQAIAMERLVGDGLHYTIVDVMVTPHYQGKGDVPEVESVMVLIEYHNKGIAKLLVKKYSNSQRKRY